jgi:hypothetical protein
MTVNVSQRNGIRFGTFDIGGIQGRFPVQAITSTNLNHARDMGIPNFNFRTNILEIVERSPNRILQDDAYRRRRIRAISEIMNQNPDKLCLLVLHRGRTIRIDRDANLVFIQFQIDCGFKIIKAFFKHGRNALHNLNEYRRSLPQDRSLMIVLDETFSPVIFQALYLNAYNHGDQMIGFLGREPKRDNNNIRLNLLFLKSRNNDKIIRLVSFTNKGFRGIVSSLIFHLFGFDVYSFWTRFGNQNRSPTELNVLNEFSYQPLTQTSNFVCAVTGTSLYTSSRRMEAQGKSSVPVSIHNIVRLNQLFEVIQDRYTRSQLELMAGSRVF